MNDEFIAVPKGLFIDNLNYDNTSPTGATPKCDVDRLVAALKQCRPVKISAPAPTPPDGGGEPAPKPEKSERTPAPFDSVPTIAKAASE